MNVSQISLEERVLIMAPVGKDALLISEALEHIGVASIVCANIYNVRREIDIGAGAVFLTEEVFEDQMNIEALLSIIDHQPEWSDLPLIVCYGKASHPIPNFFQTLSLLDDKSYLSLLERPMHPRLLVNAVRSALKARRRQYERRRAGCERLKLLAELSAAKERSEAASFEIRSILDREKDARQVAEEANRSKDVFLATLSHELRTPLNAILGFAEILKDETPGTPEFESSLATIVRNANAQRDLIDDILDVSRIISGKLALEKKHIDLISLVRETVNSFQLTLRDKKQTLEVFTDLSSAVTSADKKRLQQVFSNLLSNASKFTAPGGRIKIEMAKQGDFLSIVVSDTGEGIEAEFLPYVFDKFRQQDGSFTRRFGGLGLGLSIVKHIVEAHSGTIEATSEGKGKGAIFKVSLPLVTSCTANAASEIRPTDVRIPTIRTNEVAKNVQSGRILVIDDQTDSRKLISIVLKQAGYVVKEADSADGARRVLASDHFDAVICDIGMPVEDGLSFIKNLRKSRSPRATGLPAAALSGFVSEEDKRRALSAGFDLHLSKPVVPVQVIAAVTKLMRLRQGEEFVN